MKKVIMLVAALTLIASAVNAGPIAYIGAFTDEHVTCRQDVPVANIPFTTWIWVLPSDFGMICSEFRVDIPAWTYNIGTLANPDHSVALGDPISGVSICFSECNYGWTWLYQLTILPLAPLTPGYITIAERPDAGAYQVANCEPGYPIEPVTILNHLALNQPCEVGTETSSWGAIKNIVSE